SRPPRSSFFPYTTLFRSVFGSLTVRDNVRVSAEILKNWKRDAPDPNAVADEILDRVDLYEVAHTRADELPTGLARLVELGRALRSEEHTSELQSPCNLVC